MKTDIKYSVKDDAVTRQIAVVMSEGNFSKPLPRRRRRFRAFRVEKDGADGAAGSGSPCGADAEGADRSPRYTL